MTIPFKKFLNAFFICCLLSMASWGAETVFSAEIRAFSPANLIIYPQDERGSAHEQILQIINEAQSTIDLGAYKIEDPRIADALIKSLERKVVVRVILEKNHYQHEFNKDSQDLVLEQLLKAGAIVHERPDELKEKYPGGHMHARYFIVDGEKLVLTTGNFDQTTFDHCRDFAIVIHKNEENKGQFQLIQEIFERDWDNNPTAPSTEPTVILGPEGQREKIATFLNTATQTLQIYQQYCNDPDMADLLIALHKKGLSIQLLMMAYPTSYDKDPNQVTQDRLADAGIEVKLVNPDDQIYMHARGIILDNKVALIGTTSLSPPSLDQNRELNVVIKGKTVDALAQQFAKDWSQALSLEKGRQEAKEKKVDWTQKFSKK